MLAHVVGGAALGLIDKTLGATIPTIPLLGRAGTIAVGAYLLAKGRGGGVLRDVAVAGASIAGYQLGKEGRVSGEDEGIHGIAAQV